MNLDQFISACVNDSLNAYDPTGLRLVLEVPNYVPASLNAFVGRSRWAYPAEKALWAKRVNIAYLEAKIADRRTVFQWPLPPTWRVRVTVERITPRADALDPDNMYGACKVILDALRGLRLLQDDTARTVELVPLQPKGAPHERKTRITLEPSPARS